MTKQSAPSAPREVVDYRAGASVFKQGTPADSICYLRHGTAKEVVTSNNGKEAVVRLLNPGDFFGISALEPGNLRQCSVVAVSQITVTFLSRDAMQMKLRDDHQFAQFFMGFLLDHAVKIEAEKIDLLFNPVERRLAQRLVYLSKVSWSQQGFIGMDITQETLAAMVGTSRQLVNKYLTRLRSEGLIQYRRGGSITVLPSLLAALLHEKEQKKW